MRYLNVDLNSLCWNKLDYSQVNDLSKVTLLDKPIVFDSHEERFEFDKKYAYYVLFDVDDTSAVLCCTEQRYCADDELLEISNVIMPNLNLLNHILDSRLVFARGYDENKMPSSVHLGGRV